MLQSPNFPTRRGLPVGTCGRAVARKAKWLLRHGAYTVAGSDLHRESEEFRDFVQLAVLRLVGFAGPVTQGDHGHHLLILRNAE